MLFLCFLLLKGMYSQIIGRSRFDMYGTLELNPPLFRLADKMYFAGKIHH